jgi:hypothetical protein
MTFPIFVEDQPISRTAGSPPVDRLDDGSDRVQKLEGEVFALRDTVSRFAELMLNELKRIKPPEPPPPAAPVTMSMAGMAPVPIAIPTPQAELMARGWVLPEFFRDLTTIFRMYIDSRYRLRRATQLFVPVILFLFVLNFWIIGHIPLIGWIAVEIGTILLSILLYKILYREMVRYREVIAQYNVAEYAHREGSGFVHSAEDAAHSRQDLE